ncbi:MAG: hypothetical protein EGP82_00275 [Odoribacter splanchnicus]|nr:hypothetical protein [Odoribacter splanchnicus]
MTRVELETNTYTLLKGSGITTRIFKQDTRDPNYRGEYIEIIPLTFDESSFHASSIINVNVHVPDVNGIKNSKRIDILSEQVRTVFRQEKDATESYYTIYNNGMFSILSTLDYKDENETHFRNFRINVTYLNL